MSNNGVVKFEDVSGSAIIYRNFRGAAGTYNDEGERSFCLLLSDEVAEDMKAEGFNVRYRKPRNEEDVPTPYIPVKINFDSRRPPQINQISSRGITKLDEESVSNLDWAEITSAKISVNKYPWNFGGRSGISAYLKEMLVEIEDDSFLSNYILTNDTAD